MEEDPKLRLWMLQVQEGSKEKAEREGEGEARGDVQEHTPHQKAYLAAVREERFWNLKAFGCKRSKTIPS